MTVTNNDILEISKVVQPLIGQKAWGAALGFGNFVTVEFGKARPIDKSPTRTCGEWHLWVTYCAWRLESTTKMLSGSEDPRVKMDEAVHRLNDLTLRSVTVTTPSLATALEFSDELVMHLFPVNSLEYENWLLFTPNGKVLSVGPGMSWSYRSSSPPASTHGDAG